MQARMGPNQYGKAEIRLMKVDRDHARHVLHDLTVSVALAGDMDRVHVDGDNSPVLPTDTQKNTAYAFAREHGVAEIEDFAALLARHFVATQVAVRRATVTVEEHAWERLADHSFARSGRETRTATVRYDGDRIEVRSGLRDLVLLSSTASEFRGFATDRWTTLPETDDRILCTSVDARWRHTAPQADWRASYDAVRSALTTAFADTYSRSLQHTLYAMGARVVSTCHGVAEVRLRLPNRHHILVDLAPFGLENPGEVFHVDDRPYGLIEGTVLADGADADDGAW
ncbi:urate oxidase [Nocardioides iriomotensis]|uniref:Uricase n=2 Tax=Nocardioides iriomotensis TaxID=715784 RepID=A0A4Q5IUD4_9ACTN|nr:urate oxidase [Nocardioides iriomotensis]